MPAQSHSARTRAKGSRLPRLTGLAVIMVLAVGGVTAYLVASQSGKHHPRSGLSSKVIQVQTVGLVGQVQSTGSRESLLQLLGSQQTPVFSPLASAQVSAGLPQWTADQMADGTYIFIFLPTGNCLAASHNLHPTVQLQRCNEQSPLQRWRRSFAPVVIDRHDFYQYANGGAQGCLSMTSTASTNNYGAELAACETSPQADQLIAFWWSSS